MLLKMGRTWAEDIANHDKPRVYTKILASDSVVDLLVAWPKVPAKGFQVMLRDQMDAPCLEISLAMPSAPLFIA
ncbi:hypothetical protein FRX31_015077 [Thalictrum thalictroides]|uniref:Uncharacterized protein n=1 Tax=Thalictrum thalictroides TaxID=46969 RepID=A0A7J6WFZ0_THATH|nr:hypothetical protein FRX31_015077 [Thalictrum thalictroides]